MNPTRVLVDAHRGASATHPENTLAAFRAALSAGADSVEFDVRLTRDGAPVVIHDDTVDRTTNGEGEVGELTLDKLRALDAGSWKDPRFTGQRVPTLDETLDLLTGRARINLELKGDAVELAALAVEAIVSRRLSHQLMVSSFHPHLLGALKRQLPEVRTHLFLKRPPASGFSSAEGRYVDSLGLRHDVATGEIVAALSQQGKPVWAWTVDDPKVAVELAGRGVQAITTNDPATILRALERAGYRQG